MKFGVVICAAGALAISAGASAAPFQFVSYQAGGELPGILGAGFSTSGSFYNLTGHGDFGSADISPGDDNEEFDSFMTIDDIGPSALTGTVTSAFYGDYIAPGYNGTDGADIAGFGGQAGNYGIVEGPGSEILSNLVRVGLGIAPNPDQPTFVSGFAPLPGGGRSTLDGVFIGRLTVSRGASISGGGIFAITEGLDSFSGTFEIGGAPVVPETTESLLASQPFILTAFLVAQPNGLIDDGGFGDVPFGDGDTYDIWFHVVPTPGTLALLGLGGLAAIRRRRS